MCSHGQESLASTDFADKKHGWIERFHIVEDVFLGMRKLDLGKRIFAHLLAIECLYLAFEEADFFFVNLGLVFIHAVFVIAGNGGSIVVIAVVFIFFIEQTMRQFLSGERNRRIVEGAGERRGFVHHFSGDIVQIVADIIEAHFGREIDHCGCAVCQIVD